MVMKKILFVFIAFMCASQFFSEKRSLSNFEDNPLRKIKLAKELAEYGYATESPSALLQAAEIMLEVNVRKSQVKGEQNGKSTGETEQNKFSLDANVLFSDAKDFAGSDKTYAEWIKRIERLFSGKRGATKGPVAVEGFAYGKDGSTSYSIAFKNGDVAQIYVAAMNDINLDVGVYDSEGKAVVNGKCNDTITFTSTSNETYTVQVKNRTSSNASFTLYTD